MNKFWLLIFVSLILGTTFGWTTNFIGYGHREARFGELTYGGDVNADNVMQKLREYHSDATARIELDGDPTFDFGAMAPDTEGKHTFIVKNVGSDVLKLTLGASTCKCTIGTLDADSLAPGESTPIEMEWTVKTNKSQFSQSAELRTNDPFQPAIRLTVKGLVIRDIEFEPKKVTFGEILSGEGFEFSTTMYNYYNIKIDPLSARFGSDELTELSETTFEPFEVSEADGVHKRARQAFRVNVKVKPGLRQGPMLTMMEVLFKKTDIPSFDPNDPENAPVDTPEQRPEDVDLADQKPIDPDEKYGATLECTGRIIGAISMLENSKLSSTSAGGGYVWTLGRLDEEADLEYEAFVALKGSERDNTNLTIGETYPEDVVSASIEESRVMGSMRLFKVKLKLTPDSKPIDLLGKNRDDFGLIWIESDNPKVSRMKVAVRTYLEPRQ